MRIAPRTLAAVLLTFSAAATSAAVIDFDDLAGGSLSAGTLVTNQYAGVGVTFVDSYTGGAHAENFLGSLMPGSSAPNVLWTDQGGGSLSGQYLEVLFSSAVTGVSALFGTSLGADITLEAYSGTTLLNSLTLVGSVSSGGVLSGTIGVGDAGVTSARFFSNSGGGRSFNFSIDNLAFNSGTVPEPGTLALLGLGLAGLGVSRRRKA